MMRLYNILFQKYPFLTIGKHCESDYIGIIQNSSKNLVSIYDYTAITDKQLKDKFLALGDEWWWSSNRTVPIDIFLKFDFDIFKPYLKHFSAKEFIVLSGPIISMSNLAKKRVKKKTIILMRG